MTNLSAGAGPARFSRELILTMVPLLIGALATGGLVTWQLLPALERNRALEDRLLQIRAQTQELPQLRRRLELANQRLQTAQSQQALLLDLIAGRERIQTFLALLDQWALVTGVTLQRFEPLPQATTAVSGDVQAKRRGQEASPQQPPDPLRALGYRKTAVALQVKGSFNGLHRFLQAVEKLELLVDSSDLSLETAAKAASAPSEDAPRTATTVLSLQLGFYDRLPVPESDSKRSRPQEALS